MKASIFDYTKTQRFAVVRKLEKNRRAYCNFRVLYTERAEAEKEAVRLARLGRHGEFYVIEIQRIAVPRSHSHSKTETAAEVAA